MDVRVEPQLLRPRVQHGGEADSGAETMGGDVEECFGDGLEEKVQADPGRFAEQGMKLAGHGEDEVEIGCGQEPALLCFRPQLLLEDLTLRAVAVAARIVGRTGVAALIADLEVTAECGRTAGHQGTHDSSLVAGQAEVLRVIA